MNKFTLTPAEKALYQLAMTHFQEAQELMAALFESHGLAPMTPGTFDGTNNGNNDITFTPAASGGKPSLKIVKEDGGMTTS